MSSYSAGVFFNDMMSLRLSCRQPIGALLIVVSSIDTSALYGEHENAQ